MGLMDYELFWTPVTLRSNHQIPFMDPSGWLASRINSQGGCLYLRPCLVHHASLPCPWVRMDCLQTIIWRRYASWIWSLLLLDQLWKQHD